MLLRFQKNFQKKRESYAIIFTNLTHAQDEKRLIAEAWLLIVSLSFEYPMPSSSHLSVTGM